MMMSEHERAEYRYMQDLARNSPNDSKRRMARLWIADFHELERLASEQVLQTLAIGKHQMSLEESITKLTAALEANTAALKSAPAAGATKAGPGRPAGSTAAAAAAAAPKHTREELAAAATAYREKTDADKARLIIGATGKAEKLKDVADANVDALFDAFVAATAALDAGDGL